MKYFCSILFSSLFILFFSCSGQTAKNDKSYVNPLLTADSAKLFVADPFVYKHDSVYYLTGTTVLPEGEGFACYASTDLITWNYKGVLYRKPEDHIGVYGFWAPEVKYYDNKFYMTYSCYVEERNLMLTCLAVSEKPDGPFVDIYTPWFDLDYSAIDANIFVDDDNTPYVYFSKNGLTDGLATGELYVAKLKKDLSGLDGEPVFVSGASQEWEKVNWEKNRCNEGAFVFKRNGTYYMTYSANDTGYEYYGIGVSCANNPLGPWEKNVDNPLMSTDLAENISSPGHNSIVEAPNGDLYMFYHRHADIHCQKPNWDRVVCMDRLYFDKMGNLRVDIQKSSAKSVGWK